MNEQWQIIFCSDCHEPQVPAQLERFGNNHLCLDCVTDLLNNPDRFDLPPDHE